MSIRLSLRGGLIIASAALSAAVMGCIWTKDARDKTPEGWLVELERCKALRLPRRWPANESWTVATEEKECLQGYDFALLPRRKDLRPIEYPEPVFGGCGNEYQLYYERSIAQEIGVISVGVHELQFDISVWRNGIAICSGLVGVEVEGILDSSDVLEPVHGPAIDRAVLRACTLVEREDGIVVFVVDIDDSPGSTLDGIAVCLEARIYLDGQELMEISLFPDDRSWWRRGVSLYPCARITWIAMDLVPKSEVPRCLVKIRGVQGAGWRQIGSSSFWDGNLSVNAGAMRDAGAGKYDVESL